MLAAFLLTTLFGQISVPSFTVPPVTEHSVIFVDRGRTYIVGTQTGAVTYIDEKSPEPDNKKPVNNLTGLAKEFAQVVPMVVKDAGNRKKGSQILAKAISQVETQYSAIGLDMAQMVTLLASLTENDGIRTYWPGVALGDLLQSKGIKTKEELLAALGEIKKACEELQK